MEDQSKNKDEEQELLEEADIVIRDKDGSFSIVSGKSLLGEEDMKKQVDSPVPKQTTPIASLSQTTVSKISPLFTPQKPLSQIGKASFIVSAEDEKEIQHFRDGLDDQTEIDINAVIDEIISQAKISITDEMIKRRLRSLLASRLKDVRSPIQFAEALRASTKIGGVAFSENDAQKVEQLTNQKIKEIHTGAIKPPAIKDARKEKEIEEFAQRKAFWAIKDEIARRQEQAVKQDLPKPFVPPLPRPALPKVEFHEPRLNQKVTRVAIPRVKRPARPEGKTRMADIKITPRVVGPIEELKTVTSREFRQLGANPEGCAKKIEEKIKLLEADSLIKKAEGIGAWKQSEIYQTYLDIGSDSMAKSKSVKEIIQSRTLEGKPCLTEDEFNAVADLNKRLRF